MLKKLAIVCFILFCLFSVQGQEKSDREQSGYVGYVKSIREETSKIIFKNGEPVERARKLERISTYDISGKKLTYYAYTDEGKVLYGDTYFYDDKNKLSETKTEHAELVYLCDKKTYVYLENGKLSEELCFLKDKGLIGKTIYRYNSDGTLFEEERLPLVEAKLYFSRNTLRRYKYKKNGELDEVSSYAKENGEWKPEKDFFNEAKSLFFSIDDSRNYTQLKFDEDGKLEFVVTSQGDGKGNPLENITYFADGSIKEGNRYKCDYDEQGNSIKRIKFKWITQDGKSFFQPTEATYRIIEYFTEKEIKELEAKNKPLNNPQKNRVLQNTDKEEYAVYYTLLEKWVENQEIKSIVVKKFTDTHSINDEKPLTPENFLLRKGEKSPLEQSIVDDYNDKNFRQSAELVGDLFGSRSKINLVSDAEVSEFFGEGCREGWRKFQEKYPNSQGLTTLSRVGFNKEKTRAIVYIGHSFACLGGAGHLVYLEKQFDGWKIVNTTMVWIS